MDESVIRACVLFFYTLLEEKDLVYPSCEAVIASVRRKKYKQKSSTLYSLLIHEATQFYRRQAYRSLGRKRPFEIENPASAPLLEALKKLEERVPAEHFFPFVWQEVVKAPHEEIIQGLGLSSGTVDYRSYEVLKQWTAQE